jgi:Protein of unknown function (DUF2934)
MTETAKKATAPKKPRATAAKTTTPDGVAPKKAAPKKTAKAKVTPIAVSHEEIAMLAHRYWIERGGHHGSHEEDWLRAEQALLGKAS